ncbi:hypothetical protein HY415_01215 [Candidatus Kaiserbacteria bacterium]|nr:hypothetical protein [Candidatus Kaiserbacteria bacterium]
MKNIVAVLALATAALAVDSAQAVETSSLSSLQPFQKFGRGEGLGMAYEYWNRSKEQLVALLRDRGLAKKQLRVSCEVLVRQMAEGNPMLPFEGCEGAAAAIERDPDFAVVPCRDEMYQKNSLVVTNHNGSRFGAWRRKCLANEKVLTYKGEPVISVKCLNPVILASVVPPSQEPAAPVLSTTKGCPNGIALYANAWEYEKIPDDLQGKVDALVVAAASRDSENASNAVAYQTAALSRTLTDELIRVVGVRAPVKARVSAHLRDPQTLKIVGELGTFEFVDGIARIPLDVEHRLQIVETIWQAWFSSPSVSSAERRLWLFPNEWVKSSGGRWCTKQESGVFKVANKPQ